MAELTLRDLCSLTVDGITVYARNRMTLDIVSKALHESKYVLPAVRDRLNELVKSRASVETVKLVADAPGSHGDLVVTGTPEELRWLQHLCDLWNKANPGHAQPLLNVEPWPKPGKDNRLIAAEVLR